MTTSKNTTILTLETLHLLVDANLNDDFNVTYFEDLHTHLARLTGAEPLPALCDTPSAATLTAMRSALKDLLQAAALGEYILDDETTDWLPRFARLLLEVHVSGGMDFTDRLGFVGALLFEVIPAEAESAGGGPEVASSCGLIDSEAAIANVTALGVDGPVPARLGWALACLDHGPIVCVLPETVEITENVLGLSVREVALAL